MPLATDTATTACENTADDIITALPILVLNVHSRCNCRCVMCDIWKRDETSEIRALDLERHRISLSKLGVRWVVLSGGEPLMHSDLPGLCTFFRELGVRLTLLSTGILFERRAQEIAEFFDDVIVSVDGPPEIHDAVRRTPGSFQIIARGVSRLLELRPTLRMMARTTVQKANHNRLNATIQTARDIGLAGISYLAADLTSEAFNRPLVWPVERQNPVALTTNELRGLHDEIERIISTRGDEIRSGYIAENAEKLRRIVGHFKAHLGLESPRSPVCNAPWVSAVVEADGEVRPCFFHHSLGNIHQRSLQNIVNGEAAISFRRSLDIESNPTCQRCVCSLHHPRADEMDLREATKRG